MDEGWEPVLVRIEELVRANLSTINLLARFLARRITLLQRHIKVIVSTPGSRMKYESG